MNAEHAANAQTPANPSPLLSANPEWLAFLKTRGAHEENAQILDFGHPAAERMEWAGVRKAARSDSSDAPALLVPLTHLALIGCTGADAQSFLQNQTTNDVARLPAHGAQHSAWCSPKGRMLASFILYRHAPEASETPEGSLRDDGDGFRALLAADLCETTLAGLRKYILRAKVRLDALTGSHVTLGLAGARAEAALRAIGLAAPAQPMTTSVSAKTAVIRLVDAAIAGAPVPRYLIIAENAAAPALFDALTGAAGGMNASAPLAVPAGVPIWQALDVLAGIPLITAATCDEFVPQMLAFDKLGGVSFTKGCYPGQEIVARAHYLGKVKRSLYRLRSDAPLAAGQPITPTDSLEACGAILQAAPDPTRPDGRAHIALAVIKDSAAQSARSGASALTSGGVLIGAPEALAGESESSESSKPAEAL